jgi:hypothetical protein
MEHMIVPHSELSSIDVVATTRYVVHSLFYLFIYLFEVFAN